MMVLTHDSERKVQTWFIYEPWYPVSRVEVGPNTRLLWLDHRIGVPIPPGGRVEISALDEQL